MKEKKVKRQITNDLLRATFFLSAQTVLAASATQYLKKKSPSQKGLLDR